MTRAPLLPHRSSLPLLALLAAAGIGLTAQDRPTGTTQDPPRFRSGVDVVALDVTVVDTSGRPVDGLTPDEFTVTVDGRPRKVVTATFVDFHERPGERRAPAPTDPPSAASSAAEAPASRPGRDVFIVIDEDSLETGDGQVARQAATALLDGLGPADRVGLAIIPRLRLNFTLTTDRAANERELASWVPGVSVEPRGLYWVGVSEALAIEMNDQSAREQVLNRECGARGRTDSTCTRDVTNQARQLAMRMHARGTLTVQALQQLARALGRLPGPKTMVLVSGGLMPPESMRIFTDLEADLAASQITLYTLYFEKVSNNVARAGLSPTQADDDRIEERGLEHVTAAAGGTLLRVVGDADRYFARVATELSAAYVLGIEVAPGDRDGRPHRVAVKVSRPGLDVHGRKQYVIPSEKTTGRRP